MTGDNHDSAYVREAKAREAANPDNPGLAYIGCMIPVLVLGALTYSCVTREPSQEQKNVEVMVNSRAVIRAMLKDPDSADFTNERIADSGAYCASVNAKNSFGGYSGSQRVMVIAGMGAVEGDANLTGQGQDFTLVWNASCR